MCKISAYCNTWWLSGAEATTKYDLFCIFHLCRVVICTFSNALMVLTIQEVQPI
jgi:hypothetical protein